MTSSEKDRLALELRQTLDRAAEIAKAMRALDGTTVLLMSPRAGSGFLHNLHLGVSIRAAQEQVF